MNIGFLGCGLIASAHASNLAVVDEATIDLVYDIEGIEDQATVMLTAANDSASIKVS